MIRTQTQDSSPFHVAFQKESQIFPPTTGGAEAMCQDLKIPLLGKVPLDPRIGGCIPPAWGPCAPQLRAAGKYAGVW